MFVESLDVKPLDGEEAKNQIMKKPKYRFQLIGVVGRCSMKSLIKTTCAVSFVTEWCCFIRINGLGLIQPESVGGTVLPSCRDSISVKFPMPVLDAGFEQLPANGQHPVVLGSRKAYRARTSGSTCIAAALVDTTLPEGRLIGIVDLGDSLFAIMENALPVAACICARARCGARGASRVSTLTV